MLDVTDVSGSKLTNIKTRLSFACIVGVSALLVLVWADGRIEPTNVTARASAQAMATET